MLKEAVLILGAITVVVLGKAPLPVTNDEMFKYYYMTKPYSYDDAADKCHEIGGEIVEINDPNAAKIRDYIQSTGRTCRPALAKRVDHDGHSHCYFFQCKDKKDGTVKEPETDCTLDPWTKYKRPYVCKINSGVRVVEKRAMALQFTDTIKYKYIYHSTPTDYASADATCKQSKGTLITLPDQKIPEIRKAIAAVEMGKQCVEQFAQMVILSTSNRCYVIKCDKNTKEENEVHCDADSIEEYKNEKRPFTCKVPK